MALLMGDGGWAFRLRIGLRPTLRSMICNSILLLKLTNLLVEVESRGQETGQVVSAPALINY